MPSRLVIFFQMIKCKHIIHCNSFPLRKKKFVQLDPSVYVLKVLTRLDDFVACASTYTDASKHYAAPQKSNQCSFSRLAIRMKEP